MKKTKRYIALLLSVVMLVTVLAGCGSETEEEEKFVLRACVCDQIASLDPAMNTDRAAQSVFYTLYENLMRYVDDGTGSAVLANGIAKEYTEENNYDGTVTYRFSLRSSAHWSDGEKVTADDFVYAWRRLADPATDSPNHELLSMIQGYDTVRATGDVSALAVSAKNDTTFCVTLSYPCAYFLDGVCASVAAMPLRRDVVEKDAENWATTFNVVTDGAYRVGTWTKESYLQTKRNDKYYESRLVGPDAVRFLFADDADAAYALYESGEADYTSRIPQRVLSQDELSETWTATPLFATYCVLYNNLTDTFSDEHARKAFDLVIDRSAVAAAAGPEYSPACGLVPVGVRDSADGADAADYRSVGGELCAIDTEGYEIRCAEALDEMKLAGHYNGAGFPVVEYLYNTEEDVGGIVASCVQSMWKDALGVTVRLTGLSEEEYRERITSGEYELAGQYLTAQQNDAMSFLNCFASGSEDNAIRYSNHTYDVLMGVAKKSENTVARIAFLHDAEAMLLESAPLSPVIFGASAHSQREGLQGIYHDGLGNSYFVSASQANGT